ncbi:galactose mutarotase-like protein [Leucogyrophana mollusca]|uniref:Galactose mutarotase-like protein n=1 Tax=Leucogyrophana mollusca TaxID=85980 RepID=A0ACB8C1W1_9AGAM|nr:galactose mutarotase-like protein [Leucogyrophana mollusca]
MTKSWLCTVLAASALGSVLGSIDPLKTITVFAPDNSFQASFMARGATLTNFWVKDKQGNYRDIILGFDNHEDYVSDALGHPYFGPVVGRYANRIRNGTFTIPISKDASGPNKYHVPENENNNTDTLHGGLIGYDRRNWTVAAQTSNSVTFNLTDPDGDQGFPGAVQTSITYELDEMGVFKISMHATADKQTPIMLSCHQYWNLEAYEETQDLSGHYAQIMSSKVIGTDGLLIPNGSFVEAEGTPLDFHAAKSIGNTIPSTASYEYCGTECTGFDNAFIYDKDVMNNGKTQFSMWSINSGIRMDVVTNQPALQMYTCNGIYNATLPIPRKGSQGGPDYHYQDHSCVVIEQESYIDAINNPEYNVNQIYGPGRDYVWEAAYTFSVME